MTEIKIPETIVTYIRQEAVRLVNAELREKMVGLFYNPYKRDFDHDQLYFYLDDHNIKVVVKNIKMFGLDSAVLNDIVWDGIIDYKAFKIAAWIKGSYSMSILERTTLDLNVDITADFGKTTQVTKNRNIKLEFDYDNNISVDGDSETYFALRGNKLILESLKISKTRINFDAIPKWDIDFTKNKWLDKWIKKVAGDFVERLAGSVINNLNADNSFEALIQSEIDTILPINTWEFVRDSIIDPYKNIQEGILPRLNDKIKNEAPQEVSTNKFHNAFDDENIDYKFEMIKGINKIRLLSPGFEKENYRGSDIFMKPDSTVEITDGRWSVSTRMQVRSENDEKIECMIKFYKGNETYRAIIRHDVRDQWKGEIGGKVLYRPGKPDLRCWGYGCLNSTLNFCPDSKLITILLDPRKVDAKEYIPSLEWIRKKYKEVLSKMLVEIIEPLFKSSIKKY